jgi:hypothetical protein
MEKEAYIPVQQLCEHYHVEISFIDELREEGLIEIVEVERSTCLSHKQLALFEKILRINRELQVNVQGVDIVLNLLRKMEKLEKEVISLRNRMRIYE